MLSNLFFSFYHLPFVTLSTYFIAFHILTCNFTSYMQSFYFFFILEQWRIQGRGPGANKIMKKRRRKKSRQGKRYSQISFVSTLQLNFFSACSKKNCIRHFVLLLAHYATLASDSFTVAMLAGKKGGELGSSTFHRFLTTILLNKTSVVFILKHDQLILPCFP